MKNDKYINEELETALTDGTDEGNEVEALEGVDENISDVPDENEPSLFDDYEPSDEIADEEPEDVSEDIEDTEDTEDTEFSDADDETSIEADGGEKESGGDEDTVLADKEPSAENKTEQKQQKPRRVDSLFDFIELFVFTLAAVFIITSFFFRYSIVDGGSMQNTLQNEEALILRCFLYTPECGDIVVVQDKSTLLKNPIVKRVIATGGQTVKFTRDAVYVDGVQLDEPYVYTDDYENPFGGEDVYRYSVYPSDALLPIVTDREDGVFYEITVPDDEVFIMGDHRNNSTDSRVIGTIHEDAIIGKVVLRVLPFDKIGKID